MANVPVAVATNLPEAVQRPQLGVAAANVAMTLLSHAVTTPFVKLLAAFVAMLMLPLIADAVGPLIANVTPSPLTDPLHRPVAKNP
jgi:hypothetical protein